MHKMHKHWSLSGPKRRLPKGSREGALARLDLLFVDHVLWRTWHLHPPSSN